LDWYGLIEPKFFFECGNNIWIAICARPKFAATGSPGTSCVIANEIKVTPKINRILVNNLLVIKGIKPVPERGRLRDLLSPETGFTFTYES